MHFDAFARAPGDCGKLKSAQPGGEPKLFLLRNEHLCGPVGPSLVIAPADGLRVDRLLQVER